MWEFDTELSETIKRTPAIKSFRFPVPDKGANYEAGQFFFVSIKINGNEAVHHFSFSSSPTEKGYLEFTKRITSSEYSQALAKMKPGDWAHLRGPYGHFTLPIKERMLAFLSGGIGITPLRSMLRYIVDKKLSYNVILLYGNSCEDDIAFCQELDAMAASYPDIRVEHVISDPILPTDWQGKIGRIDQSLIAKAITDYRERLFYISGAPKMVLALKEQLISLGVPEVQLKQDSFTGYD